MPLRTHGAALSHLFLLSVGLMMMIYIRQVSPGKRKNSTATEMRRVSYLFASYLLQRNVFGLDERREVKSIRGGVQFVVQIGLTPAVLDK